MIVAIFFGVCLAFLLPFDYLKYKRSLYYKNTKKKYTFFAATSQNFKFYNEINKNNLPIKFIHHPKEKSMVYGWFVFGKTLIIPDVPSFGYDSNSEKWVLSGEYDDEENQVLLSVDEYIKNELEEVNQALNETLCDRAVILICGDDLENVEKAYKEESFLVYNGDMIEKLALFCQKGE